MSMDEKDPVAPERRLAGEIDLAAIERDDILRDIRDTFDGLDVTSMPDALFVFYDPGGKTPPDKRQPFATIVWSDAISDVASDLTRRGLFRLNVGVERETYRAMFGPEPKWGEAPTYIVATGHDFTQRDVWMPHPVYAPMSWVCIVAPTAAQWPRIRELVAEAHAKAKAAFDRTRSG